MKIKRKAYALMSPSELVNLMMELILRNYTDYGDMTRNQCRRHINFRTAGPFALSAFKLAFEKLVEKGSLVKAGRTQRSDVYHFEIPDSEARFNKPSLY